MRKDTREINQFVKEIQNRATLGTPPLTFDLAVLTRQFHQLLASDHRFDDVHKIALVTEVADFVADRRKPTALNFDQSLAIDHVDAVPAKLDFDGRIFLAKDFFELMVKRIFHYSHFRGPGSPTFFAEVRVLIQINRPLLR